MIDVRDVTKKYGTVEAVKGVSFSLDAGEILGFLGPNGAGKTTIMKILTGYHFPGSGSARIDGIDIAENPVEVKRRIGYLPEMVPLYGDLTVREYLSFVAAARLLPKDAVPAAVEAAIASCGLAEMADRGIETLSKGYRQRTGLAQAIVHDPPILILDEPTTGLDPNQIIEIRGLIKELGKKKTVILSTHILREVEAVCSQVLILSGGRIAAQGKPEEIAATLRGGGTWELVIKGPPAGESGAVKVREKLAKFALSADLEISSLETEITGGGAVRAAFVLSGGEAAAGAAGEGLFDWAVTEGWKFLEMKNRRISLEDIFVQLTGSEPLTGEPAAGGAAPESAGGKE